MRVVRFVTVSLRRVGLQVAATMGVALTVALWLTSPAPGWSGWDAAPWPMPAAAHARLPLREVTLLALPEGRAAHAAVLRDGLPVSRFAGGPVTVVAAPGDRLAVSSGGVSGLTLRVLAVGPGVVWPRAGLALPLSPGVTDLGPVRLVPDTRAPGG